MADEVPGSWCDKVASTPSIGATASNFYATSNTVLEKMAPLFESWAQKGLPRAKISSIEPFKLEISAPGGFIYSVIENRAAVEFRHSVNIKPKSGSLPSMDITTPTYPYTRLLGEVTERLVEFWNVIDPKGSAHITKVGVVSSTVITAEDSPPGINRMLKHFSRPWTEAPLRAFDYLFSAPIESQFEDSCIHRFSKVEQENPDGLLTLVLDYQRDYGKEKLRTGSQLNSLCQATLGDALKYFERLGKGID